MTDDTTSSLLKYSSNPNSHYLERYIKFIAYCESVTCDGYTENHHIIPRSFSGSDVQTNLVRLSARCHFIAHVLLAKATNSPKMIKALHKMIYSTTGDVQRNYKISSRVYEYVREKHAKVVSDYSKGTVVAKQIYTEEVRRIPVALFNKYNGILYESLAKGRRDSFGTRLKKQIASQKTRNVRQGLKSRSIAASLYSYLTPKGFCQTSADLKILYPSFTKNTLLVIDNDVIITNKFASIHKDFRGHVGKTFEEYGITKILRKENGKN